MHTNQVASNCAVCGKYLAVGSGVSAGGDDPRTFCHPGCAEAIAPQTAAAIAVVRPNHRWSGSEQLEREDRRASGTRHAVRPRVAGVSGGLAMLVGLALLLVASGEDDDGPSSRPVGGSAPEVSALGVTETTPEQDASSAAKSPIGADPADGPAARARPRGSVTSRNPKAAPPLVPAPDDQAPPSSGGSGSPTAPSGTVSSSPPSSGPPHDGSADDVTPSQRPVDHERSADDHHRAVDDDRATDHHTDHRAHDDTDHDRSDDGAVVAIHDRSGAIDRAVDLHVGCAAHLRVAEHARRLARATVASVRTAVNARRPRRRPPPGAVLSRPVAKRDAGRQGPEELARTPGVGNACAVRIVRHRCPQQGFRGQGRTVLTGQ